MTKVSGLLTRQMVYGQPVNVMLSEYVDRGELFTTVAEDGTLADSSTLGLLIKTGSVPPRAAVSGSLGGDGYITLYEGVIVSADGEVSSWFNRNRLMAGTPPESLAYKNPTVTDYGVQVVKVFLPGGTGSKGSAGVMAAIPLHWVLKQDTNYLLELQNTSGAEQPADLWLDLAESG